MAPELSHNLNCFLCFVGRRQHVVYCWSFEENNVANIKRSPQVVCGLGVGDLTHNTISSAETFVCNIFNVPDHAHTTNEFRFMLFSLVKKSEASPSTSDSLKLHIMRTHDRSMVWKQANCSQPNLPWPTDSGW